MRFFWPWLMILCYGILDAISTLKVFLQVGTFEYEMGVLTNILYGLGGVEAVIIFKLMLTSIAAILLHYIAKNIPRLDKLCILTCVGASIVGLLAASSNLMGVQTGSTLWVFGIRGDVIAYMLFTGFFLAGIADFVLSSRARHTVRQTDS